MTVIVDEIELLENIDTLEDDEKEHLICVSCYPGYDPGRLVKCVCGFVGRDDHPGTLTDRDDLTCSTCHDANFCPACGHNLWD